MRCYLGAAPLISFAPMLPTRAPAMEQPEPEAEASDKADDMAALDDPRGEFIAGYNGGGADGKAPEWIWRGK